MKRSPLQRRSPLCSRPRRASTPDHSQRAWKEPQRGFCACCTRPCWRLERHHVCYAQHVRKEGGDLWALDNSMLLHPECHAAHHSGSRKIPIDRLPDAALDFMVRLLGRDRAALYVARYYAARGGSPV